MTARTRVAVIGAGRLGTFHARLASQNEAFDLVAIADPVAEAAEKLAAEVGSTAVGDPGRLLGRIDAAIVASPTVTHHAITKPLLEAGVHCLVEKPIASNSTEATDLVDAAARGGAVLQVGHVERFNPAMSVAAEELRDPRFIRASRTSGYTFRSTDIGVVLDLMIHDIDLVLGLVRSPVIDVSAIGVSVLGDHEDLATSELRFENGCVAQLTASRVSYEPERTMQVFTTKGFASLDFGSGKATVVRPREDVLRRAFRVAGLSADEREAYRAGLFDELLAKSTSEAPAVNAIEEEQRDFADAIATGREPRVSGAAGRDAVAVAERVLEKIADHAWDGDASGRVGMFPTPALPIVPAAHLWAGPSNTGDAAARKAG